MTTSYIGLGSNLGDPVAQLQQAVKALSNLPQTQLLDCSPFYRNPPLDGSVQADYVNAVAALKTTLTPRHLLTALQAIEIQQGRIRTEQRFAARTLDLDILLYGDEIITRPNLTIPHYALTERLFFLYPLAVIAPDLVLPDGQSLAALLQQLTTETNSNFRIIAI